MLCADTSFLFSLYRKDAHTPAAVALLARLRLPLKLSVLNEYEFGNALRFAEFRGMFARGEADQRLRAFEQDRVAARWKHSGVAIEDIVDEAGKISAGHTVKGGHRAFDVLHVAHARLAAPRLFLSFDANQLALAKAVGLAVGP